MGTSGYHAEPLGRADVDELSGAALLVFGTDWCGYCRAAERPLQTALAEHPEVTVIKVEDGPGRPLGRSYRVKLWPSLIFLRDGVEADRLVRPTSAEQIAAGLHAIDPR